jgi:hypothetical protein
MAQLSQISDIIEEIKKQNENETKGQLSRLEIIFMEILQVLKTNLEDAKKHAALERTFQEEKDYEDEKRHKEFIDVLKNFVSMQPIEMEQREPQKEDGSGFLDFLKNFLKGLVLKFTGLIKNIFKVIGKLAKFSFLILKKVTGILLKIVKTLGKLALKFGKLLGGAIKKLFQLMKHPNVMKFLSGLRAGVPLAILLGGIYAGREALSELARRMPDFSKIDYKEAENVLRSGSQRDIEHFSNKLPSEYVDRPELGPNEPDIPAKTKLELYVRDAKKQRMADLQRKFDREGTLSDEEQAELNSLQNEPIVPVVTQTQLPRVSPRPAEGGSNARAIEWDRKYGTTHSSIGSGRGGEAEYVDYLARKLESTGQTGAVFGTYPSAGRRSVSTAAPITPEKPAVVVPTAKPMIHEGDEAPKTGPNSFERLDADAYTMPMPSEVKSEPAAVRIERNAYDMRTSEEESLRQFINQNKALHLRNELKSMSLEYEELGRILKGTSTQPIKPEVTPSPISQILNNATVANNDLVLRNMFTLEDQVINNVSNNGRTEVLPDTPMSVEASQRDDTYTLTTVLNRYKKAYV